MVDIRIDKSTYAAQIAFRLDVEIWEMSVSGWE